MPGRSLVWNAARIRLLTRETTALLLDLNLRRIGCHDLRAAPVGLYLARDADRLVAVRRFWRPELLSISTPNHDGELLIGIRLIEIQERRLSLGPDGVVGRGHSSAYGRGLTDVGSGLLWC